MTGLGEQVIRDGSGGSWTEAGAIEFLDAVTSHLDAIADQLRQLLGVEETPDELNARIDRLGEAWLACTEDRYAFTGAWPHIRMLQDPHGAVALAASKLGAAVSSFEGPAASFVEAARAVPRLAEVIPPEALLWLAEGYPREP